MATTHPAALAPTLSVSIFDRKPFYTLVAAIGSALIAVSGLVVLLTAVLDGALAEAGVFALIMLVPGLLGLFLSWKVGRGSFIVVTLLAAALLLMFAPFLPFSLAHPEAAADFIMAELFVVGALLTVIGGAAGTVQWRRRSAKAGATAGQRWALKVVLGLTAALALASLVLSLMARTSLDAATRAGTTPVGIQHGVYSVDPLTVATGETVRLAVRNDDSVLHTFTLDEAGIDVVIAPGSERLVEFTAPAAGTYTWYCVPHSGQTPEGRQGMVGKLIVAP